MEARSSQEDRGDVLRPCRAVLMAQKTVCGQALTPHPCVFCSEGSDLLQCVCELHPGRVDMSGHLSAKAVQGRDAGDLSAQAGHQ